MKPNTARITGFIMFPIEVKELADGKTAEVALELLGKSDDSPEHLTVTVVGNDASNIANSYEPGDVIELEAEISVVMDHYINFNGDKILYPKVTFTNGKQF